jgi:hypothetical protein
VILSSREQEPRSAATIERRIAAHPPFRTGKILR